MAAELPSEPRPAAKLVPRSEVPFASGSLPQGTKTADASANQLQGGSSSSLPLEGSITDNTSAEAASASLWAEFERRRKADRQQRKKKASEVQQILVAIQQERHSSVDGSCLATSPTSPVTPAVASGSSTPPRQPLELTPTKPSEIQKILAEVQQERLALSASTREASPEKAKPKAACSHKPKAACPKALVHATASPVRQLNFRGAAPSQPEKPSHPDRPVNQHRLKFLSRPKSPPQCTLQPRAKSPPALSANDRPNSSERNREHQLGSLYKSEERRWAAGFRMSVASHVDSNHVFGKEQRMAYPAGGWDDRTGCPRTFDGFAAEETSTSTSPPPSLRRQSSASSVVPPRQQWDERTSCPNHFGNFLDIHGGRGRGRGRRRASGQQRP